MMAKDCAIRRYPMQHATAREDAAQDVPTSIYGMECKEEIIRSIHEFRQAQHVIGDEDKNQLALRLAHTPLHAASLIFLLFQEI